MLGCAHIDSHSQKRTHNHNPAAKFRSKVVLLFWFVKFDAFPKMAHLLPYGQRINLLQSSVL